MSAWVVSKHHIDLLVRAMIHNGRGADRFSWYFPDEGSTPRHHVDEFAERYDEEERDGRGLVSPSRAGQILVDENVASVHHRYPSDDVDHGELPGPIDAYYMGPYVYENPGYTLTPGELFKALDCFEYQACEHEGWGSSQAYAICEALRRAGCRRVDGYEAAAWGFDKADAEGLSLEFSRRIL